MQARIKRQTTASQPQMSLGAPLCTARLPESQVKRLQKNFGGALGHTVCNAYAQLAAQYEEEALDLVQRITSEPFVVHAQHMATGTALSGDRGLVEDVAAVPAPYASFFELDGYY